MPYEKTLMISTCGTSLLTGCRLPTEVLRRVANSTEGDLSQADRAAVDEARRAAEEKLQDERLGLAERCVMCAELAGISLYYDETFPRRGPEASGQKHVFIATDTYIGFTAAEAIRVFIEAQGMHAETNKVAHLATRNITDFQYGLDGITAWCEEHIPNIREEGCRVVFNLSGGFKGILAWMQALSTFYADECIYTFEGTRELLRIPKLPVASLNIQHDLEVFVRKNLPLFAKLAEPRSICLVTDIPNGAPEMLFRTVPDGRELSAMGRLIWRRVRRTHYQ